MSESMFGEGARPLSNRKARDLDIIPKEYIPLRRSVADILGGAVAGDQQLSLGGIPEYQGTRAVPVGVQERNIVNAIADRAGQPVQRAGFDNLLSLFAGGGTALQQAGQQGILDTLAGNFLGPDSNPWLRKTVEAAQGDLQYDWENRVLPNLRSSFTGAGHTITPGSFGSSAFDRAGALAANEQTRQMQDLATEIYGQNYQAERARMMEALGLGQTETAQRIGAQTAGLESQQAVQQQNLAERQAQTQELVSSLQAAALPRLVEQYGADVGMQEFQTRMQQLLQLLGMEVGVAQPQIVGNSPIPGRSGSFGDVMQVAGPVIGAAAAAAFSSDYRLKTDILPLGMSFRGVPLYEYRYRWDAPHNRRWGVMAQEAPAHARVIMPSGFLAVQYGAL